MQINLLCSLLLLPALVSASSHLLVRSSSSSLIGRQAGAAACAASCTSASDLSALTAITNCASTDATCICDNSNDLSTACLDCILTAENLTPAQWTADCGSGGGVITGAGSASGSAPSASPSATSYCTTTCVSMADQASGCANSDLTCLCTNARMLSSTCLSCWLQLADLTQAQYQAECASGTGSNSAGGSGGNGNSLGAAPTTSSSGSGSAPTTGTSGGETSGAETVVVGGPPHTCVLSSTGTPLDSNISTPMVESQNVAALLRESPQKTPLAPAVPVDLWEPEAGEADFNFALPSFPFIVGVDVAGVVVKVGEGVTKFKVGDRVVTMTPLGKGIRFGVYQKYCCARVDATIPIPDSYTFDEASTTPLAYWTAALGLFISLQIPLPLSPSGKVSPTVKDETLLVWGGSSSVGALAIQLGVIAGFRVITTASPRNFEYVKSLGAKAVLDYHNTDIISQIKGLAPNLRYAFDAITEHGSIEAVLSSLSHPAAEVVIVLDFDGTLPPGVKTHKVFAGGIYYPGNESQITALIPLWDAVMSQGKIKPNPIKLMPDGLNSIEEGFDLMRQRKVSGQKLVYHPWETKI
ncbi:NADP-binding protein [Dacryopinax primogenitus]|uniref:NADP-binding protein n=1 Tax=Dacryopinax primogenitus (strain DJM 731) TaxID=1858805 RepID=M5FTL3_DACPD|nr:NADP-binding protein [Dacryopinax primogenitus]EJT98739.1 NADP-binding protein [Dacryopinax primogenitus]